MIIASCFQVSIVRSGTLVASLVSAVSGLTVAGYKINGTDVAPSALSMEENVAHTSSVKDDGEIAAVDYDGQRGQGRRFTKDSTVSFGPGGPTLRACPWYKWNQAGDPVLPRGPSLLGGVECREKALRESMDSFRKGGNFIIVEDGTELSAHVGGTHNAPNDYDLDASTVTVDKTTSDSADTLIETLGIENQKTTKVAKNAATLTSSSTYVKISFKVVNGECTQSWTVSGGTKVLSATRSETVAYIENKICLCVADGIESVCDIEGAITKEPAWTPYGETYWMPLPGTKNLGLDWALWTYIGLKPQFEHWRLDTWKDIKTWDTDKDGQVSLPEVLDLASSKGVSTEWLELTKKDDPCVIVNGQRMLDFEYRLLQDLGEADPATVLELKNLGLYAKTIDYKPDWKGAHEYLVNKHDLIHADPAACRTAVEGAKVGS